jgi:peptidoglycan/xylan/chitin deacetylase (PgdA/CDA1 family)
MRKLHAFNISFLILFLLGACQSYLLCIAIAFLWLSIHIWSCFNMKFNMYLPSINKVDTSQRVVAITFDDGPTECTELVLELLRKYNAQATFFCVGKNIEKHYELAQLILEQGHEIGNHSYSHSCFNGFYPAVKVAEEISATNTLLGKLGVSNDFYRPPNGVVNTMIANAVSMTQQRVIGWNIRSYDTIFKNPTHIYERIIGKLAPGSIILLHDTSQKTVEVLEKLLEHLSSSNYGAVTISQLLDENRDLPNSL